MNNEFLYKKYYNTLFFTCRKYSKTIEDAEDLLQDSFIIIFDKLNNYKNTGSLEGWMRRIVTNCAIDKIRRNKMIFVDEKYIDTFEQIEEEYSLLNIYKTVHVVEAIDKLSNSCKNVFDLYVNENKKHKEIAKILNISVGASKSNLSKAKVKIRKILENKK